jgi:hypothetical protein
MKMLAPSSRMKCSVEHEAGEPRFYTVSSWETAAICITRELHYCG